MMLLSFAFMLVQSFLKLCMNNLGNVYAFALLFYGLGLTCTPMICYQSAIFTKMTTVAHSVALEWPSMFLSVNAMLVGPANLLGFLGNAGVN